MENKSTGEYEVIDLKTKEVMEVVFISISPEKVETKLRTAGGDIIGVDFINDGLGNLKNDSYAIREKGTQETPNDDGVVNDNGEEILVSPETISKIDNGEVDPDAITTEDADGDGEADDIENLG